MLYMVSVVYMPLTIPPQRKRKVSTRSVAKMLLVLTEKLEKLERKVQKRTKTIIPDLL